MSNIAAVLKGEIARIARKELRSETEQLKKSSTRHRSEIAALKREITALRKQVMQLSRNGRAAPVADAGDVGKQLRFSPARLKRHRERLELSAAKFGQLFDVSGQTIYLWENGGSRPGKDQLIKISQLRKLTKREAHSIVNAT